MDTTGTHHQSLSLIFRGFQGEPDIEPLVALQHRIAEFDTVDPQSSREALPPAVELRSAWRSVAVEDPNYVLVEINTILVGYGTILWWTEQDGTPVYLHLGYILPEWRGKGIGTALLRRVQMQIRTRAAAQNTDSTATFATNVSSTHGDAKHLMDKNGYTIVHALSDMAFTIVNQFAETQLPADVEIRMYQPEHASDVYAVYADAWAGAAFLPETDDAKRASFVANVLSGDPDLYSVAWWRNEAVGIVLCSIRNGVGTVDEVEVRKAWQRKGIARALLVRSLNRLAEHGLDAVRLYTAANNRFGARSLYESIGFREVKQHYFYRKPLRDDEHRT